MTIRTLLMTLMVTALACGVALGETKVTASDGAVTKVIKGDGTMTIEVRVNADDSRGVWLGVRIMPVPAPLAAHLTSGPSGVMVSNLVKDSPAHKGGLKRYDVIVGIDGKDVKDGPALIKALRGHKAGDKVKIAVVQKGKTKTVPIVLAKPVPAAEAKLVHKDDGADVFREELRLHPQIIFGGGQGKWKQMDDKNLPEELRKLMKDLPHLKIEPDGANIQMKTRTVIRKKDSEGRDVQIEQDETGQITVKRTTIGEDGKKTEDVSTYKDADELRKMDKEAYEVHKSSNVRAFSAARVGGKGIMIGRPNIIVGGGAGAIDGAKLSKEIREQLLKSIGTMNLPEDVRKQIMDQLKQQGLSVPKSVEQADPAEKKDKKAPKPKKPRKPKKVKTPKNKIKTPA